MTYLDWFILIAVAAGLIRGLMVGAIRQVASIIGLLLAFVVAVQLMRPIGDITVDSLGLSESTAPLVGFVVVFAGVQLLVVALARTLEAVVETLSLSFANRAAGGALGAFKAALLLSVLFLVTTQAGIPDQQAQGNSVLYRPVASVLPGTWDYVAAYLPAMREASDAFGREVRPRLAPSVPDDADRDAGPDAAPDSTDTRPDAGTDVVGVSLLERFRTWVRGGEATRADSLRAETKGRDPSAGRPSATGWTGLPPTRSTQIGVDGMPGAMRDSTGAPQADPGAVIVTFFKNL